MTRRFRQEVREAALRVGPTALLVAALLLTPARARADDEPVLILSGCELVPEDVARRAAGRTPRTLDGREVWVDGAARRIVAAYRERGYRYARAWGRVAPDTGVVRIEVDEGRMHRVVFVGAGSVNALIFRVAFDLPKQVFHRATLKEALDRLRTKHDLQNVYYRVTEGGETATPHLGVLVPERVLRIVVVSRESFGWDVNVGSNSTWGLLPSVGVRLRDLLLEDDRFRADLAVAVPYRRYLFDAEPAFLWVHGQLGLSYRLPAFVGGHVAPFLAAGTAVSRYERTDIDMERFLTVRTPVTLGVALLFAPVTVEVGFGLEHAAHFAIERTAETEGGPGTPELLRYGAQLRVAVELDPDALRRDLRDEVELQLTFASTASGEWMLAIRPRAQVVFHVSRHDLLLAARGVYLTGEVRFWDELPLAGEFQRAFFGNRYWVRAAAQLTAAFRLAVWKETVKIGLFHDLSAYADRTRSGAPWAVADAFGPSFHAMLWDVLALDIYYAFGFAEVGFSHNLSFSLATVF